MRRIFRPETTRGAYLLSNQEQARETPASELPACSDALPGDYVFSLSHLVYILPSVYRLLIPRNCCDLILVPSSFHYRQTETGDGHGSSLTMSQCPPGPCQMKRPFTLLGKVILYPRSFDTWNIYLFDSLLIVFIQTNAMRHRARASTNT